MGIFKYYSSKFEIKENDSLVIEKCSITEEYYSEDIKKTSDLETYLSEKGRSEFNIYKKRDLRIK